MAGEQTLWLTFQVREGWVESSVMSKHETERPVGEQTLRLTFQVREGWWWVKITLHHVGTRDRGVVVGV